MEGEIGAITLLLETVTELTVKAKPLIQIEKVENLETPKAISMLPPFELVKFTGIGSESFNGYLTTFRATADGQNPSGP